MGKKIKQRKRLNRFFIPLIVILASLSLRWWIINPLINRYGETTVGHIYMRSRDGHGDTSCHYYYCVSGKEYKARVHEEYSSNIEVKYLRQCPRIHIVSESDDKE